MTDGGWAAAAYVPVYATDEDRSFAWGHAFAYADRQYPDSDAAAYATWYVDGFYGPDDDVMTAPGHNVAFWRWADDNGQGV